MLVCTLPGDEWWSPKYRANKQILSIYSVQMFLSKNDGNFVFEYYYTICFIPVLRDNIAKACMKMCV